MAGPFLYLHATAHRTTSRTAGILPLPDVRSSRSGRHSALVSAIYPTIPHTERPVYPLDSRGIADWLGCCLVDWWTLNGMGADKRKGPYGGSGMLDI